MPSTDRSGFLARASGSGERICVTATRDGQVVGADGRRYVDFISGWCVGNLGWDNDAVEDAVSSFDGPTYVYPGHDYAPWEELAEALVRIAPGKLARCFRATGGSEAVEIALQAAMLHTGRRRFVTIEGCYHGNTIGARSLGDEETRGAFPGLLPKPRTIRPPLGRERLAQVETALKRRDVAAFIMEPVVCNLGAVVGEPEFMRGVQSLCRHYGTLLILDEVATGFGRTGRMFAVEHSGVAPDLLCLAKALTSGYAPMGATLATEPVARSMLKVGAYSTYGWHPRSVAAALATLAYWREHGKALLARVEAMSRFIVARLERMDLGPEAEVRGRGLAIGVELGDEERAEAIRARCQAAGLLIAAEGFAIALFPPLLVDEGLAGEALDILSRCAAS